MLSLPRLETIVADKNNGSHRNMLLGETVHCYTCYSIYKSGRASAFGVLASTPLYIFQSKSNQHFKHNFISKVDEGYLH